LSCREKVTEWAGTTGAGLFLLAFLGQQKQVRPQGSLSKFN